MFQIQEENPPVEKSIYLILSFLDVQVSVA